MEFQSRASLRTRRARVQQVMPPRPGGVKRTDPPNCSVVSTLVEAAIESRADLRAAERAGAGRVELCASLGVGGLTPSGGVVRAVVAASRLPVHVIVRPRGGGFVYDGDDVEAMLHDIALARSLGAHGIVSGALATTRSIDAEVTRALIEASAPLPFTFHRAFDLTPDLTDSLDILMSLGAARVLTSGGARRAWEGRVMLAELVHRAGRWITVLGGGAVRASGVADLVQATGLRELHLGPRLYARPSEADELKAVGIGRSWDHLEATVLDEVEVAETVRAVATLAGTPYITG